MLVNIFFGLLATIIFLFVFWKRLKEDYSSNIIFSTGFLALFGMFLGNYVSSLFLPQWWFWSSFLGALLGVGVGVLRFRLRFFETLEAGIFGLLPYLALIFLADSVNNLSVVSLGASLVVFSFVLLFIFFDAHYKSFVWYKSGRVGFSGLTSLGALFLIRASIAATSQHVLSFVGKLDAILSAVVAFAAFLAVYNLARRS